MAMISPMYRKIDKPDLVYIHCGFADTNYECPCCQIMYVAMYTANPTYSSPCNYILLHKQIVFSNLKTHHGKIWYFINSPPHDRTS